MGWFREGNGDLENGRGHPEGDRVSRQEIETQSGVASQGEVWGFREGTEV